MTVNKNDNEDHYHKSNADTCEKHDVTFKMFKIKLRLKFLNYTAKIKAPGKRNVSVEINFLHF